MPEGIKIMPDEINELDPCIYGVKEIHKGVTVAVMQCKNCGNIEIVWYSTPEAEHNYDPTQEDIDELDELLLTNNLGE